MKQTGITTAAQTLAAIRADIAGDDPRLAQRLSQDTGTAADHGFSDLFSLAAPAAVRHEGDYLRSLEYICEGYLLHYGTSRLLVPDGLDFALLAGDYMYARGLNHLTARGDLAAIGILAGLISFCSRVHCEGTETAAVADAWAVATLRIAAATGGGAAGMAAAGAAAGALGEPDAALEEILGNYPAAGQAAIRDELCNIYDSFNRQRRQDGTG